MIDSLFVSFFFLFFFLVAVVRPWRRAKGEFQSFENLVDSSGMDPGKDDWSMRDFSGCELSVEM